MMSKIYKTKIEDNEIIEAIIDELSEIHFKELIDESPIFKHKCGMNSNKKGSLNLSKARSAAKDLYKSNIKFKKDIVELWNDHIIFINQVYLANKSLKEEIEAKLESEEKTDLLEYATLCWSDKSKKMKELGDRGYELYKNILDKNDEYEEESDIMDNNFMNLSIGQALQIISENENNNKKLKEELEQKENENKKLKESLLSFNKEFKKEMTAVRKALKSVDKLINEKEQEFKKEINELKEDNSEIKALLKKIDEKIDLDYTAKKIIEKQKDSNNTLKGHIIDSLDKKVSSLLDSMEIKIINEMEKFKSTVSYNKEECINEPQSIQSQVAEVKNEKENSGKDFKEMAEEYDFF